MEARRLAVVQRRRLHRVLRVAHEGVDPEATEFSSRLVSERYLDLATVTKKTTRSVIFAPSPLSFSWFRISLLLFLFQFSFLDLDYRYGAFCGFVYSFGSRFVCHLKFNYCY